MAKTALENILWSIYFIWVVHLRLLLVIHDKMYYKLATYYINTVNPIYVRKLLQYKCFNFFLIQPGQSCTIPLLPMWSSFYIYLFYVGCCSYGVRSNEITQLRMGANRSHITMLWMIYQVIIRWCTTGLYVVASTSYMSLTNSYLLQYH